MLGSELQNFSLQIARELNIKPHQVEATVALLDQESTVPFISRYRKEVTGNLDEVVITSIRDRIHQLRELDKRRLTILQSVQEQGKLTDELKQKILAATTLSTLEDIYLPYRPKRRTRATIAKEKGLEPLAQKIFAQEGIDPEKEAVEYVNAEKGVLSAQDALAGARDIIAEWINEDASVRAKLRALYFEKGIIQSKVNKGKEQEGQKYKDYFDWQEVAKIAPSHRILAMRRAEKETILSLRILVPDQEVMMILGKQFVKGKGKDSYEVAQAMEDSFKRLLSISLETELRLELKKKADQEAIRVFSENLRQLLMAPPLGNKNILAIDPGLRTGCKVVCLDRQGKLLANDTIYPFTGERERAAAHEALPLLIKKYQAEVVAIGNGTASRETEEFVRSLKLPKEIAVIIASESGASVYSASDVAREEFPEHDVTVRGAISIGRRLMDPLAELVKIDPKAIGVGQYQHDVDQTKLKDSLDDVVVSCVNQVGVQVNTASKPLLMYVSGVGPTRAQAIMDYRNSHGPFQSRAELLKVSGFGAKAFEQAAGFLRIPDGKNPLDASAVHPESYPIVERMALDLECHIEDLMKNDNFRKQIDLKKYTTEKIGLPTLQDIVVELAKPGRDPREPFELFTYAQGVSSLEDLKPGMKLPGVVTNITAFGAFVDVGVHCDGLIHISQMADRYVKDPYDVVSVHQKVQVTVLEVDLQRKRIALSMKSNVLI